MRSIASIVLALLLVGAPLRAFLDQLAGAALNLAADKAAEKAAEALAKKVTESAFFQQLMPGKLSPSTAGKPKKILASVGLQGAEQCDFKAKQTALSLDMLLPGLQDQGIEYDHLRVAVQKSGKTTVLWAPKAQVLDAVLQSKERLSGGTLLVGDVGRLFPLSSDGCHWMIPTVPAKDIKARASYTRVSDAEIRVILNALAEGGDIPWVADDSGVYEAARGDSAESKLIADERDQLALGGAALYISFNEKRMVERMSQRDFYWDRPRANSSLPKELLGTWDSKAAKVSFVIRSDKTIQIFDEGVDAGRTECMVIEPKGKDFILLAYLEEEDSPPRTWKLRWIEGDLEMVEHKDKLRFAKR